MQGLTLAKLPSTARRSGTIILPSSKPCWTPAQTSMLKTATALRPCIGPCAFESRPGGRPGATWTAARSTEARDVDGRTPLHVAARFADNQPKSWRTLLDHGANFDAKDNGGDTPLDLAKRHYNPTRPSKYWRTAAQLKAAESAKLSEGTSSRVGMT